ncbi:hypothetical protein [Oryzicola mucosus]|uniref:Uncharacterized protein n=1 Tax=Oryzicola mucosus TaxID=2767425 RepID=A0A8J6TY76_9HYPH|nr:hypothetical protein [Oryzicola mucosus]MBD0414204.1 hypothetical protein [Oryzicola mucosus]
MAYIQSAGFPSKFLLVCMVGFVSLLPLLHPLAEVQIVSRPREEPSKIPIKSGLKIRQPLTVNEGLLARADTFCASVLLSGQKKKNNAAAKISLISNMVILNTVSIKSSDVGGRKFIELCTNNMNYQESFLEVEGYGSDDGFFVYVASRNSDRNNNGILNVRTSYIVRPIYAWTSYARGVSMVFLIIMTPLLLFFAMKNRKFQ